MEVGCSGGRTRLVMCAQPSYLLYFVLRGMITSGCTLGAATEGDAIEERQL